MCRPVGAFFVAGANFWAEHAKKTKIYAGDTGSYYCAHITYVVAHWATSTVNCTKINLLLVTHCL